MTIRKNIMELIESDTTAYTVSKETGLARTPIERLFRGESSVDRLTLKSAEILSDYWTEKKIKENE